MGGRLGVACGMSRQKEVSLQVVKKVPGPRGQPHQQRGIIRERITYGVDGYGVACGMSRQKVVSQQVVKKVPGLRGQPHQQRVVYVKPPKEADVGEGVVWRLKRCLYGLSDASRQFYLSV
ncbi:hypothetical protein SK128_001342 [Halocaridina rubra]|uniref:Uncharacterized protein n=1 Tax=Halocaridina rubra TaxID=373956 RepID=A0AAN9A6D9_HALRR